MFKSAGNTSFNLTFLNNLCISIVWRGDALDRSETADIMIWDALTDEVFSFGISNEAYFVLPDDVVKIMYECQQSLHLADLEKRLKSLNYYFKNNQN